MRRFFLFALLALFVIPAAAFAQDGKALWDLTSEFTVADLGFKFNYPAGWVYSTDNGIYLAETQADLDVQLDGDDSTVPQGFSIGVVGVSLETVGLEPDAKLEDVVELVLAQAGITEQDRSELSVMSRRSISIFGVNKAGRPGIGSIWLQNGYIVVMNVGGAEASSDLAFSWGQILGSVNPVGALEFADTPLTSPNGDFTIAYPKDWFASEEDGGVAELEADLKTIRGTGTPEGTVVGVIQVKLADLGKDVTDLESLAASMKTGQGWDDTFIPSEHILLDQPALTYVGETESVPGFTVIITIMAQDDNATIIAVAVPLKDKVEDFMPTYIAMLASIKAVEKAS